MADLDENINYGINQSIHSDTNMNKDLFSSGLRKRLVSGKSDGEEYNGEVKKDDNDLGEIVLELDSSGDEH